MWADRDPDGRRVLELVERRISRFTMVNPFVIGLDLGQVQDHSAIAVVEKTFPVDSTTDIPQPAVYAVRHLERLPLGTPYPKVAARLVELFDRQPLAGGTLVVDETGLGRPVVDLLRTLPIKATFRPLTITSGSRARLDATGRWRVPKRMLVATAIGPNRTNGGPRRRSFSTAKQPSLTALMSPSTFKATPTRRASSRSCRAEAVIRNVPSN